MKTFTTEKYRWTGFAFICLSLLVVSINDTIVNIILPLIAQDLQSSTSELQWITDSYILVIASLLLTVGTLSDRYGRKLFLQIGVIIFSGSSILGFFARSAEILILARSLQGIGSAIIMPSTLSLISSTFKKREDHSKAIAIWSAMFGLGVSIGPLLGGWIVHMPHFTWNTTFLVNLPFALIALPGTHFFVEESKDSKAPKTDILGVILSTISLFALVFGIIEAGGGQGFSPQVIISLLIFVVFLAIFLAWEKHYPHAMLPLFLFKNPHFTIANIAMTMVLFGLIGISFLLPQYFQGVQGYSPLETAIRLLPQTILSVVVSIFSARLVKLIGIKRTMVNGFLIAAIGFIFFVFILQPHTAYPLILIGLIIIFFGIDTAMPATTMSIMNSIPVEKAGIGSAMNDMTGQIGGALGVAIFGTLLNRRFYSQTLQLKTQVSGQELTSIQNSIFSAHETILNLPENLHSSLLDLVDRAFVSGMKEALVVCIVTLVLISILTAVFMPTEIRQSSLEEEKTGKEKEALAEKKDHLTANILIPEME